MYVYDCTKVPKVRVSKSKPKDFFFFYFILFSNMSYY